MKQSQTGSRVLSVESEEQWLCETHHAVMSPWPGKDPKACHVLHYLEEIADLREDWSKPDLCRFVRVTLTYVEDSPSRPLREDT